MKFFTKNIRWLIMSLLLVTGLDNAWGQETLAYSADFTKVGTHSYTQNKTFTLSDKDWTASVSQVQSNVFFLGTNTTSDNPAKGVLGNNATFSDINTALKSVDEQYTSGTSHAYALRFDNAYSNVTKVEFTWSGTNNAFQVYLFGYSGSGYTLLNSTNHTENNTSTGGNVTWTGDATNFTKFAIVARPGTTTSTATSKTLRATAFNIYTSSSSTDKSVVTTTTIDASGITNTDANQEPKTGKLIATVKDNNGTTIDDATVTWSSSKEEVATVDAEGTVTLIGAGATTITATYAGETNTYKSSSATYELTVTKSFKIEDGVFILDQIDNDYGSGIEKSSAKVQSGTWTAVHVVMKSEGRTAWGAGKDTDFRLYKANGTQAAGSLTFSLTNDCPEGTVITKITFEGTNLNYLTPSVDTNGVWEGNAATVTFTTTGNDAVQLTKIVVEKGIQKTPCASDITLTPTSLYKGDTGTFTVEGTAAEGATVTYSIADVDNAYLTVVDGEYVANDAGTATVTVTATPSDTDTFAEVVKTFDITVEEKTFIDPALAFSQTTVSLTTENYNTAFVQPTLTNTYNVAVKYSSNNTKVATVDANGTVTLTGERGAAVIKAESEEYDTYAASTASYTIVVSEVAIDRTIDLCGSKRTLTFTDFSTALVNYVESKTEAPFSVDGTMNGTTATYQWIGTNVIKSGQQLLLHDADGKVKSWSVYSDAGFRVRVFVQTAAESAKSTLGVTDGDDETVSGKYDDYVLKTSTSTTTDAIVTLASTAKALYIKQIDLIPICQDYPNLKLSKTSITLESNQAVDVPELTKADGYDGEITWTSSSETVASVNATTGEVTIHSTGSVVITATASETDNYTFETVSYILTVNPISSKGSQYFYESFNNLNGTGGRDNKFKDANGSNFADTTKTDKTWSKYGYTFEAKECARLGSGSSNTSELVSESINVTGDATLTFSAAGWGDDKKNTLTVSATGGTLSNTDAITLENGVWKNYTIDITGAEGNLVLTFAGHRGFIDEIRVFGNVVSTNISAAEYSTYVVPENIIVDTDTRVYTVTEASTTAVTLTEVPNGTILPEGAAVVLNGSAGAHTFAPTSDKAATLDGNLLQATTTDLVCNETLYPRMYVLNKVNDKVGFYRLKKDATLVAGRAYLLIDEDTDNEAKSYLSFNFNENNTTVTSIEQPTAIRTVNTEAIYNLNGQRVSNPTKGLYIIGGKKVLIK